jgi:hypothetical protein
VFAREQALHDATGCVLLTFTDAVCPGEGGGRSPTAHATSFMPGTMTRKPQIPMDHYSGDRLQISYIVFMLTTCLLVKEVA